MVTNPLSARACIDVSTCPDLMPCSCKANEFCVQIARDCNTCPKNQCVLQTPVKQSGGGVSKGALAGGVIGAIVFLGLVIAFFLHRRKAALVRKHRSVPREVKKEVPASAETVLNRPDPAEKVQAELRTSTSNTIDLDPHAEASTSHPPHGFRPPINPFDDNNSIQTAGTGGTNVIPIALVPADANRLSSAHTDSQTSSSSYPSRPPRSPELNLNLEHVNVSHENVRNGYSQSTRSGISGISSRNSYMSNASYSSDFLNEAPMIMTSSKGNVRQVLGVMKAEVISAGSLSANNSSDNLKPPAYSRPSVKSPLASTSFGPSDMLKEADESQEVNNPFNDNMSTNADYAASPAASTTTYGRLSTQTNQVGDANWVPDGPILPWSRSADQSRPSSMSTQAGSVIDIASATRVNVGLKTPASANSYRTTMGRLVTPPTGNGGQTLQEQQQLALAHAQAQAQAQGLDRRRISGSSMLSATSTRADSILESFPFVPPSPISDRPIRSPPVSPLGQQSFTNSSSPLHQHTFTIAPPSPATSQTFAQEGSKAATNNQDETLPAPPNRRTLGLSTGSQLSTMSSGLGSFPFQIESDPLSESKPPPSPFNVPRQRASLDTLALTSDLSSYPLGFDRDSVQPPKK
ncbi:hypothetical protein JR316_0005079 [Psilocybe cubensis]|uniref:Uncharacterized protein n=2 Tax=Psilocybe cubensis TaxID=181762 RepID=A0ACB8H566_PSICU|nr:hypothetical protein JR316_0005079 [Psilocybe cubensis]KAH9482979.1 hypothetical protein JR316_0005079 [Psilocybe cubensis]